MFIIQNIIDFYNNPMGKGSTAIQSKNVVVQDLIRRYNVIINDKNKKISFNVYKKDNRYLIHFLIPSEKKGAKNNYDVILDFVPLDDKDVLNDKDIKRYPVRYFSNCPSFTYTYAYAFMVYESLVPELIKKYKKEVIDKAPMSRNPGLIMNYEKTIFFAIYHLLNTEKSYLNKNVLDMNHKTFSSDVINKIIRNTDKIELEIKLESNRLKKEEKKESTLKTTNEEKNRKSLTKITNKSSLNKIKARKSSKKKITARKSTIKKK